MPGWLSRALTRVHRLAAEERVRLTYKALREAAELGLGAEDVCDVLAGVRAADSAGRLVSERTGEWMYIFKPTVGSAIVYVKLILRSDCVVVSFHEDNGDGHEEDA